MILSQITILDNERDGVRKREVKGATIVDVANKMELRKYGK